MSDDVLQGVLSTAIGTIWGLNKRQRDIGYAQDMQEKLKQVLLETSEVSAKTMVVLTITSNTSDLYFNYQGLDNISSLFYLVII